MFARHLKKGRSGEEMAQAFLRGQGYNILHTNWHNRKGELDIICSQKEAIVFVEVKTRSDNQKGLPGQALTLKKQKKLIKTASAYLSKHKLWGRPCRFDLIAISLDRQDCKIEHVPNVFEFPYTMGGSHSYWQPW